MMQQSHFRTQIARNDGEGECKTALQQLSRTQFSRNGEGSTETLQPHSRSQIARQWEGK